MYQEREFIVESPNNRFGQGELLRHLTNLYRAYVLILVGELLADVLPSWLSPAVMLAASIWALCVLKRLGNFNPRYRTALNWGIAGLVVSIIPLIGTILGSIFLLISAFQEYKAHSEIAAPYSVELANKWSNLFLLKIVIMVVTVVLGLIVGLLLLLFVGANVIGTIISAILSLFLNLIYLRYLKQTLALLR